MRYQLLWLLTVVLWLQLYGLITVLIGLVGVKKDDLEVTPIPSHFDGEKFNLPVCSYKHNVNKIVLLVVDAMRIDFLSDATMPFTSSLLEQSHGCFFLSTVKSPTVTLPRIKALVSGDISTYWDIIQNFHSKKISQDNFIWHAVADANKKIAFYGDDTWMTLFPNEFVRSEGTTSFYVTDFEEVDRNVTRHLEQELSGDLDWDMLILHYLGLDHIGHVHGPNSPLVPGKLREMDSVVKKVYEYLSRVGSRSILIVCGDHGMANIGGHGGNSYHEVTTPLLIFSTEKITNCSNQGDWRNLYEMPSVEQIDVATSISALWGLTLPAASAGKVIWQLFDHLPLVEKLFLAYYNAIQLLKFSKGSETDFSSQLANIRSHHSSFLLEESQNNEQGEEVLKLYQSLLTPMSKFAGDQLGEQDLLQILSGMMVCFQSVYLLKHTWGGTYVGFLELVAMWIPVGVFFVGGVSTTITAIIQAAIIIISFVKIQVFQSPLNEPSSSESPLTIYCLELINYFTPFSYFSSSFIEEEHYLRYFLWACAIIFLFLVSPQLRRTDGVTTLKIFYQIIAILVLHRVGIAWNQTGQKWNHLKDLADLLRESSVLSFLVPLSVIVLCFTRRRKLDWLSVMIIASITGTKCDIILSIPYFQQPIQLIMVLILSYVIFCILGRTKSKILITNLFIFLTLLLQKYENIPLVTIVLLQAESLTLLFSKLIPKGRTWSLTLSGILVFWLSNAVFFYQGNSNSIASIDVNAGYIGLSSYNEVLVGLLIFCNTFSLPVLVLLAYFETSNTGIQRSSTDDDIVPAFFTILAKTNSATVCIYSVVILSLRHHLFIWSVFAPKLLYVIAQSLLYALITLVYSIANEINHNYMKY